MRWFRQDKTTADASDTPSRHPLIPPEVQAPPRWGLLLPFNEDDAAG